MDGGREGKKGGVGGGAVVKWIGADECLSFVCNKENEEMKNG